MTTTTLAPQRVARAKVAYTTRLVRPESMLRLLDTPRLRPRSGDVVLARVTDLGQHTRLTLPDGRKATLFVDDEIIVAYGNRYAPDQFEAEVPDDLGPCELVAGGGVAGRALSAHARMSDPTLLHPLGFITDADGRRLNLRDWRLPELADAQARPPMIAVVGSSMNAGKTTAAACLIKGLSGIGLAVGAAKITGTGAGNDPWLMSDAGAELVFDFTHAGHSSTYRSSPAEVAEIFRTLTAHLAAAGVDVIVLEVADGVFQDETAALLRDPQVIAALDGVLFAAAEALGAVAGVAELRALGLPNLAVCGVLTASPLASREARAALPDVVVLGRAELAHPLIAEQLLAEASGHRAAPSRMPSALRSA